VQYRLDLDRRPNRIMAIVPIGAKLRRRIGRIREHLFVFVTNRDVPPTNNVSEQHLRPGVIFRNVTNGFRCESGAETDAAFRSVVGTANANRVSVLGVLRAVLLTSHPELPITDPG
jgi:transposase